MIHDVILNKISVIERCLKRIHEEYEDNPKHLGNYTKQDSIVLNLQRACEASCTKKARTSTNKPRRFHSFRTTRHHLLILVTENESDGRISQYRRA